MGLRKRKYSQNRKKALLRRLRDDPLKASNKLSVIMHDESHFKLNGTNCAGNNTITAKKELE